MREKQEKGSASSSGRTRTKKDFNALYEEAKHKSTEGWCGIPASSFRNAMVDACRLANTKMNYAKLTVFTIADGFDAEDKTPLVQIVKGEPEYSELGVRLKPSGKFDVRPRPMWMPGWEAIVKIKFDSDYLSVDSVANLLVRAGIQVGIGEGRPYSKDSVGMGWGTFEVLGTDA